MQRSALPRQSSAELYTELPVQSSAMLCTAPAALLEALCVLHKGCAYLSISMRDSVSLSLFSTFSPSYINFLLITFSHNFCQNVGSCNNDRTPSLLQSFPCTGNADSVLGMEVKDQDGTNIFEMDPSIDTCLWIVRSPQILDVLW